MEIVVIKKILVAATVLMLGLATAFAGPPAPGRAPGSAGDFRPQGSGFDGNGRPPPQHEQDANQRRGKLSADERRELRRQIDEAGQDIYRVKR